MTPTIASLADELWAYLLATQPYYALRVGVPVERLRPESLDDALHDQAAGRSIRAKLQRVAQAGMSGPERLTAEFLGDACGRLEESPECWWTAFPYTPYNAHAIAYAGQLILPAHAFRSAQDVERYLGLVADLGAQVRTQTARLEAQAQRGWRIPRPALPGARATLAGFTDAVPAWVSVTPARIEQLAAADRGRLREGIDDLLHSVLLPALQSAREALGAGYEEAAPDAVGLSQYPGGEAAYDRWIRRHMTVELAARDVHELGKREVGRLTAAMAELRGRLRFGGDEGAFADELRVRGRMFATGPADVEARYRRAIERIRPQIGRYFRNCPQAEYDVRRLDPAVEPGMTYGYYEPPTPSQPIGLYRFNGSGLDTRSQLNAAALIYHELVPGHHFHLARQAENAALPQIRRQSLDISVFNEGWAEYASGLAGEMGLYDDPYDAYGRLVHERFTAQRLVVDTGLNALGWSLERAREYMQRHTLESPAQVATETLRYSTDLPGQALAYRVGYLQFMEIRESMRTALGPRFDLRDFHEAVLAEGALPLPVLRRHVERTAERLASGSA